MRTISKLSCGLLGAAGLLLLFSSPARASRRLPVASRARPLASSVASPPVAAPAPGLREDELFEQSDSVAAWRAWNARWEAPNSVLTDELARSVGESVRRDPARALAYWAYHTGRAGFFAAQWPAAYFAFSASRGPGGQAPPSIDPAQAASAMPRLLGEAFSTFADDLACIEAGVYPLPFDLTSPSHRQFSPLFAVRQAAIFVNEAVANLEKRGKPAPPLWLDAPSMPEYYRTFHYQSDGYMSTRSAAVYEASTEALFLGRQDAMQRLTLVPLARVVSEHFARPGGEWGARKLDLLEIGCGTGRFHTFMLDAFGNRLASTSALDVSPFYLEKARENVAYAQRLRRWPDARADVRFLLANAEEVPLDDESQDVVVSVYMFHELPESAQRAIVREVGRLLRPGGAFILTDSLQLGDRPALDATLPLFKNLNEPFYERFVQTSLAELVREEAGLVPEWKGLRSATKTLSFRKPAAAPPAAPPAPPPAASPVAPPAV